MAVNPLTFPTNLVNMVDEEEGVSFPSYIRVDAESQRVIITSRGSQAEGHPAPTTVIEMTLPEFKAMILKAQTELTRMQARGG